MPKPTTNTLQEALEKRARMKLESEYTRVANAIAQCPGLRHALEHSGAIIVVGDKKESLHYALWDSNGVLFKAAMENALPDAVKAETQILLSQVDAVQELLENQQ